MPNPNRLERSVVGRVQRGTDMNRFAGVDLGSPNSVTVNSNVAASGGGTPGCDVTRGKENGQSVTPTKPILGNWGGTNLLPINMGLV